MITVPETKALSFCPMRQNALSKLQKSTNSSPLVANGCPIFAGAVGVKTSFALLEQRTNRSKRGYQS